MVGIAVIALPSGIITAGYMEELRKRRKLDEIKMQKQELSISDRLRS